MSSEGFPQPHLIRYMSHAPRQEGSLISTKPISADEYSKNKIAELQEEVGKLRKEMAQRECIWSKEKNQLLSRAQILNLESVQIKQRLAQLLKVNQTLEMALGAKEEAEGRTARKDDCQLREVQQELTDKNKTIKELKKMTQQLKKKIVMIEDDKNRVIEAKDQKIDALSVANKQLMMDQQAQMSAIKKELSSLPFNREMIGAIMRILNGFNPHQLTYDDLQDEQYCQSPVTKRYSDNKDWSRNLKQKDSSFSRISSHSIISQLNTNQLRSEYSQEDQAEKLLCEVCRKVYEQKDFINHMDECNKMKLQQNRQRLEKDLRDLDQEHRKSLSQLKRKPTRELQNPLRDLTNNNNINTSSSKLQKKGSKVIKDPQQRPGNFSQLITHEYRSNKYY